MFEIREITAEIAIVMLDLMAFSNETGTSNKRELEKAGTKFALRKLLNTTDFILLYSPQNKPFLEGESSNISISHSHSKLVVIANKTENTGIDIELIRDTVLKIRHKFLNDEESMFAKENVEKLIAIWAAKEAMYKYYGLKNLDFKLNLSVKDFDGEFIFGKIETKDFKKSLRMAKEKVGDYMMVYILNEVEN